MRLDKLSVAQRRGGRSFPQDMPLPALATIWFGNHTSETFRWLDIACGNASIIRQFQNLFPKLHDRVHYHGYDIVHDFILEGEQTSIECGVHAQFHSGEMSALRHHFGDQLYAAVTLVNAIHELPLRCIADLLFDAISLCDEDGFVYIFDVATLPYSEPEPGALPWRLADANLMLHWLSDRLDARVPISASAYHSTQGGWYCILNRKALPEDAVKCIMNNKKELRDSFETVMLETFRQRRDDIDREIQKQAQEYHEKQSELRSASHPDTDAEMLTQRIQALDTQFRNFWACEFELADLIRSRNPRSAAV